MPRTAESSPTAALVSSNKITKTVPEGTGRRFSKARARSYTVGPAVHVCVTQNVTVTCTTAKRSEHGV